MAETRDPEARFLKLEEKVAYQEKTIADLNDVVIDLNRRIDELRLRLEAAERSLRNELAARDMPNERPPHY
jgi:SlyX protein